MYRGNDGLEQEDKFGFINNMLDTFYAHRKLYNSVRQVSMSTFAILPLSVQDSTDVPDRRNGIHLIRLY